ncbi:MAG: hypothetical protein ABIF77_03980 [bacterium]
MISKELLALLKTNVFTGRIIWFAFMAAPLFYTFILFLITKGSGAGRDATETGIDLTLPLTALAVIHALGGFFYRRHAFSAEKLKKMLTGPPDLEAAARNSQTKQVNQDRLQQFQAFPEDDQHLIGLAYYYQTTGIINMAIWEAIAVYGLVLGIIRQEFPVLLPFMLASLALNTICFPRLREFLEMAQRLQPRVWGKR